MHDQNYNAKPQPRLAGLRKSAIGLLSLLLVICASVLTTSAQNSNGSKPGSSGTVAIDGKVYVLVPSQTFERIERLTDLSLAIQDENKALKAENANLAATVTASEKLVAIERQTREAETRRAEALEKALTAEKEAGRLDREAVNRAQARITELEQKVKRANRRTVFAIIGAAVTLLVGGLNN